jgi:hypothetical protein
VRSENFESLSDEDLRAIADRMGLGLPAELDRVFVIEEILDALEEDSPEGESGPESQIYIEDRKYWCKDCPDIGAGFVPRLEPRYNETMIKALVRDPSWAFALWDISESERSALDASGEDSQFFLRVTELGEGPPSFFDIPITTDDLQWYINLPRPEARYRIDLAAKTGSRFRILAHTCEIAVPRQHIDGRGSIQETRDLLLLSGYEDLDIEETSDDNPLRILRSGI